MIKSSETANSIFENPFINDLIENNVRIDVDRQKLLMEKLNCIESDELTLDILEVAESKLQ